MNTLQKKTARATDWEKINAEAFAHSLIPVALPQRDGIPFWNANARQFIMPPAFEAPPLPGASSYRFTLKDREGKELAAFDSASPQDPLTPVWDRIPVGDVQLSIEALDEQGKSMQQVFQRNFYRCAWFHGPYPSISHDYRKAAMRALAYLYNLPHVQGWLTGGTVDEKVYRKYCYPSKTLSAIIRGLNLYADHVDDPEVKKKALTISRYMADWLIANSCPAGSPMEYIPPTYWKHATYHLAKPNIGQIMMTYPAMVGNAYLTIYRRTQDRQYLDAALRLGNTMKKLELPSGSWPLKMREADGKPTVENVVLITGDMIRFFTQLAELSGDESFAQLRDRAYRRLLDHNLKLWDWDGQFEDVIPTKMYQNLTKNHAHCLAADLLQKGDVATALRIVDWSEDQFVVWSDPSPALEASMYPEGKQCESMITPAALEQYNCYWPVDASISNFISIWSKVYRTTGDPVYLEKAKAMADSILRNQRPDGSIPTWFFSIDLPDWLNCMVYTAETLLEIAEITE